MTDLPERLEALASILETKAATANAKADEHEKLHEPREAMLQRARASNGASYAAVCREAARRLKIKAKLSKFTPPTWEEVVAFSHEKLTSWPLADVQAWFDHFESNGWKVSGRAPMRNWQAAARNGYRNWKAKTGKVETRATSDPEGWREYLRSIKRPYREHRFEEEHIRTDFRTHKKAQK